VRRRRGAEAAVALVLAAGSAELAARLLRPRKRLPTPAPVDIGSYFSAQEIERGRRYARPQMAIGITRATLDLAALAAIVRLAPAPLRRLDEHPVRGGAATAAGLTVGLSLSTLPLAAVARRRAMAVGLITQSWRGWAVDLLKGTGISAAMSAAAGGLAVEVISRYPRGWWAPAAAGSVVVGAGLTALAPVVLDPVFNDFTPLPEGRRRSDVPELADAAGVKVGEVYSVDASRRGTAANAYVAGLGPTKRVVLFDTLLDRYTRDEVRVVVAHELAHVRHRDVPRLFGYAALVAPGAALAVQRVSWTLSDARGGPSSLPSLALAAAIVSGAVGVIGNRLSRAIERRADDFSLRLTDAPGAFITFERAIALQNVGDLDPPRWLTGILATHPPTAERIGAAVAYDKPASAPQALAP
jgi:Zn-dependent protease with chaperone function